MPKIKRANFLHNFLFKLLEIGFDDGSQPIKAKFSLRFNSFLIKVGFAFIGIWKENLITSFICLTTGLGRLKSSIQVISQRSFLCSVDQLKSIAELHLIIERFH